MSDNNANNDSSRYDLGELARNYGPQADRNRAKPLLIEPVTFISKMIEGSETVLGLSINDMMVQVVQTTLETFYAQMVDVSEAQGATPEDIARLTAAFHAATGKAMPQVMATAGNDSNKALINSFIKLGLGATFLAAIGDDAPTDVQTFINDVQHDHNMANIREMERRLEEHRRNLD